MSVISLTSAWSSEGSCKLRQRGGKARTGSPVLHLNLLWTTHIEECAYSFPRLCPTVITECRFGLSRAHLCRLQIRLFHLLLGERWPLRNRGQIESGNWTLSKDLGRERGDTPEERKKREKKQYQRRHLICGGTWGIWCVTLWPHLCWNCQGQQLCRGLRRWCLKQKGSEVRMETNVCLPNTCPKTHSRCICVRAEGPVTTPDEVRISAHPLSPLLEKAVRIVTFPARGTLSRHSLHAVMEKQVAFSEAHLSRSQLSCLLVVQWCLWWEENQENKRMRQGTP